MATTIPAATFATLLDTLRSDHTPVEEKVALMNRLHPALSALFDKVCPASHWKDPIDCIVELDADERVMVEYAVEFFTATKATVTPTCSAFGWTLYRVTADGYRRGPAGDH